MTTALSPSSIRPPFGNYHHGISVPAGARLVVTSGQLGASSDDVVPEAVEDQAEICFQNIKAILAEADMTMSDIVRLNAFVTDRTHFPAYMVVRDRYVGPLLPASTLVIVSGFTRPEFKVEVEALAARVD